MSRQSPGYLGEEHSTVSGDEGGEDAETREARSEKIRKGQLVEVLLPPRGKSGFFGAIRGRRRMKSQSLWRER